MANPDQRASLLPPAQPLGAGPAQSLRLPAAGRQPPPGVWSGEPGPAPMHGWLRRAFRTLTGSEGPGEMPGSGLSCPEARGQFGPHAWAFPSPAAGPARGGLPSAPRFSAPGGRVAPQMGPQDPESWGLGGGLELILSGSLWATHWAGSIVAAWVGWAAVGGLPPCSPPAPRPACWPRPEGPPRFRGGGEGQAPGPWLLERKPADQDPPGLSRPRRVTAGARGPGPRGSASRSLPRPHADQGPLGAPARHPVLLPGSGRRVGIPPLSGSSGVGNMPNPGRHAGQFQQRPAGGGVAPLRVPVEATEEPAWAPDGAGSRGIAPALSLGPEHSQPSHLAAWRLCGLGRVACRPGASVPSPMALGSAQLAIIVPFSRRRD